MINIRIPNVAAARAWILRLDPRLVTPQLQQHWMDLEYEAAMTELEIKNEMYHMGLVSLYRKSLDA